MSNPRLTLSKVKPDDLAAAGSLLAAMSKMRDEISEQLLGSKTARPFSFSVEEDDGGYGAPAWTNPGPGAVHIARETLDGLRRADGDAVKAVAHQLLHSIGDGPAFPDLESQLLEEAIVETLTQMYLGPLVEAFGSASGFDQVPLVRPLPQWNDLEIARITATSVSVERFARLAAWAGGFDGSATVEELQEIVTWWALRLKVLHGADRFSGLADAGAAQESSEQGDIKTAAAWLEDYLRGYMKTLDRSRTGFAGLAYATARAFGDEVERPALAIRDAADTTLLHLERVESVTLAPSPVPGEMNDAMRAAESDPDVDAAVHRSLDARALLWAARSLHASRLAQ